MPLDKIYIYRMTHIGNIHHIIRYGITHKNSDRSNKDYITIGDASLINSRDTHQLGNGASLGDYIPFYFGYRSPMLYVIQNGFNGVTAIEPSDIIYCVSSVQKIIDAKIDFLYTDGHATDRFTAFYSPKEVNGIKDQVDFTATNKKFWNDEKDLDLKRRKEAEFLIKGDLGFKNILGFITFDENARIKLGQLGIDIKKIVVRPDYYFNS